MNKSNHSIVYPNFKNRSAKELYDTVLSDIDSYKQEIAEIRKIKVEEATFENVILALEQAGKALDVSTNTFFNLSYCDADDELMKRSEMLNPILSDLSNEVAMDTHIANCVKRVFEEESSHLSEIDQRLTYRKYEGYKNSGVFLDEEKREQLKALRKELSMATLKFGQNVLIEQNEYTLHIEDEKGISRLPVSALEVAKNKAKEHHLEGWLFDFSFPSYIALISYADDRSIREQIYRDRQMLCYDKEKETCNINEIYKIVGLRQKIASILGYRNYSECVLKDRMAKSTSNVYSMLNDLRVSYLPLAQKEVAEIKAFAQTCKEHPLIGELEPWDWAYYVQLYKAKHLNFDEEKTRPYFELSSVMKAMLSLASDLYDIQFSENRDLVAYREDVTVYDVTDSNGLVGTLMTDFFPRKGKQSGAWMTNYVEAYDEVRPVVSLVMNFTPATEERPALLTFNEVTTLFHEFGHGLHGLLTRVPYASLSGTNVVRDFVELPSQIMENWMSCREFVHSFAQHYITGEPIPEEILDAIEKNDKFLSGYNCIRQLTFGYLDMAWHTLSREELGNDINQFEQKVAEPLRLLPSVHQGAISTSFTHIFSGGYAAGYYGYKWAEILDADAFDEFLQRGIRDHETATRFKKEILERGDAEDANTLYINFKGREASIEALKRRSGIES